MTKPIGLHKRHSTKAEKEARYEAQLSLSPVTELPDMPPELKDHAYAAAKYRRLIGLYSETLAEIVTAFDLDLLVDYCLSLEEGAEFAALRSDLMRRIRSAQKSRKKDSGEVVGFLAEKILEIDAALKRTRAQAHRLREALYLTPQRRAGKAPPRKPTEPEADEMDEILREADEATRGNV